MTVEKVSTAGWSLEKWQSWRRKVQTIGGSDAAVVLGLNPYKSPYSLWAEKTGAVVPEDISGKEAVRLGNDLEEYVAKRWTEKTGKKVCRKNAILSNPEYPFAHANIDRAVIGEPDAGLECKTTSSFDMTRKLRAGDIPDSWYCQCMHYMMVTGAERWYLAVVAFGAGFYDFTIARDNEEISELASAEQAFYESILFGPAPSPDGSISSLDTMSKLMIQNHRRLRRSFLPDGIQRDQKADRASGGSAPRSRSKYKGIHGGRGEGSVQQILCKLEDSGTQHL